MQDLDLVQLMVFDAIYRYRSIIKAARALDLPQSTVSRWLSKLRVRFADPLFVRTQRGMEPTTTATEYAEPITEIVRIYQTKLRTGAGFEPSTTSREFNIATSDIGSLMILPALNRWSESEAPAARFTAISLGRRDIITGLESGAIDLAVGSFDELYGSVKSQTLGLDHYVCLVRRDHPMSGRSLSLKTFSNAHHILVGARGAGQTHKRVEKRLLEVCSPQNVRLVAGSFLVGGLLLGMDDFILTVPSLVAKALNLHKDFVASPPPIDLPDLQVLQYWHERFDSDQGNRWLRKGVWRLFRNSRHRSKAAEVADKPRSLPQRGSLRLVAS